MSVPRPFASGDVYEWLQKLKSSAKQMGWTHGTKALKLPTLVEGEAHVVWLELTESEQADHEVAKKTL